MSAEMLKKKIFLSKNKQKVTIVDKYLKNKKQMESLLDNYNSIATYNKKQPSQDVKNSWNDFMKIHKIETPSMDAKHLNQPEPYLKAVINLKRGNNREERYQSKE